MQEVGLASRAVLMYDTEEVDWEDLMYACTWLSYSGYLPTTLSGSDVRSGWAGYDRHNRTQFSLREDHSPPETTFLDSLESARRRRKATDPRDMVYAFLEHPDSHPSSPDYFQSVELVYYNFAVSYLKGYENPSILSYATRSTECDSTEGLPS